MFLGSIVLLVFTLFLNARIVKSWLSPAALMLMAWITVFLLILVFRYNYYEFDESVIAYITICVCLFSFSSIIVGVMFNGQTTKKGYGDRELYPIFATVLLLLSIVALPFYILRQIQIAGSTGNVLYSIRSATLDLSSDSSNIFANFLIFSYFLSIFFILSGNKKYRTALIISSIATCAIYSLFTGSKLNIISLILVVLLASTIKSGRIKIYQLLSALIASIVLFMVGAYFINFNAIGEKASVGFYQLTDILLEYLIGGTLAFSQHFDYINQFANNQSTLRIFYFLADKLGFSIPLESLHAPYVAIAPGKLTNVYTTFFPFVKDYGIIGTPIVFSILGLVLSLIFVKSRRGDLASKGIYCALGVLIIQTVFNESIFFSLFTLFKGYVVLLLCQLPYRSLIHANNKNENDVKRAVNLQQSGS